jgi:hypothetical protein
MSLLMNHVRSWCGQNRQALHAWFTAPLFQKLVNQTGMAMWGVHGVTTWSDQIAFLKTDAGRKYTDRVETELREFVLRGYRNNNNWNTRDLDSIAMAVYCDSCEPVDATVAFTPQHNDPLAVGPHDGVLLNRLQ